MKPIPAIVDGLMMHDRLGLWMEPIQFLAQIWTPWVLAYGVPTTPPPEWLRLRGLEQPPAAS